MSEVIFCSIFKLMFALVCAGVHEGWDLQLLQRPGAAFSLPFIEELIFKFTAAENSNIHLNNLHGGGRARRDQGYLPLISVFFNEL